MKYLYVPFLFILAVLFENYFNSNNTKMLVSINLKDKQVKQAERKIASEPESTNSNATWNEKLKKYINLK